MKYTKTIKVDFYLCDGQHPMSGRKCLEPATEKWQNNHDRIEWHFCPEHGDREKCTLTASNEGVILTPAEEEACGYTEHPFGGMWCASCRNW